MRTAAYLFVVGLILLSGYTVYRFAMVKHACEEAFLASQTAIYPDPGAGASREAAGKAALASPACVQTKNIAAFVLAFGRDN